MVQAPALAGFLMFNCRRHFLRFPTPSFTTHHNDTFFFLQTLQHKDQPANLVSIVVDIILHTQSITMFALSEEAKVLLLHDDCARSKGISC